MNKPKLPNIAEALTRANEAEARWRAAKKKKGEKDIGLLDLLEREMGGAADTVRRLMALAMTRDGSYARDLSERSVWMAEWRRREAVACRLRCEMRAQTAETLQSAAAAYEAAKEAAEDAFDAGTLSENEFRILEAQTETI